MDEQEGSNPVNVETVDNSAVENSQENSGVEVDNSVTEQSSEGTSPSESPANVEAEVVPGAQEDLHAADNAEVPSVIPGEEPVSQTDQALTIARICHEANKAYCESLGDESQPSWNDAPLWQRESAVKGVEYHLANPEATPADSHNSWLQVKLSEGWVYGPVKNEREKTHPCILPYEMLPAEQQKKDYLFSAIVRALA